MTVDHHVVAGGPGDFMTVTQLVAQGSEVEIGRALAEAAVRTYGWRPVPADPEVARARRRWFARNWPQHHARMRGAATVLGVDPDSDEVYLDGLTGVPNGSACSATSCPPSMTKDAGALLGRNYDFFVTSAEALFAMLGGAQVEHDDQPPMASRPYVVTSRPDDGYATTIVTMNELDGCMEGVNEHGLAVALLIADAETAAPPLTTGPQVGLSSVQLPRFVLDTCATAAEARAALLDAKQYDLGTPLHYLIADASGDAFVWERGPAGDEHIISVDGGALCVTNHLLHKQPAAEARPADDEESLFTYSRYQALRERTQDTTLSGADLRVSLDALGFDASSPTDYPVRTLWRTVFDLDARAMATRFYLGDTPEGSARNTAELVFSATRAV